MNEHERPSRRGDVRRGAPVRRAFALPMVVLLALIASLAVGVLLERQSGGHLAVQRAIGSYRDHHRMVGMEVMVDRWLGPSRPSSLTDRLGDDGLAFELRQPHGRFTRVYISDGQGAALSNLGAVTGPAADYARRVRDALTPRQETTDEELLRDAGPVKVSANTAPQAVIEAVASVVIGDNSDRFVRDLITKRAKTRLTTQDLNTVIQEAHLTPEQSAGLEMLLTAEPSLWRVDVKTTEPDVPRPQWARGLLEVGPGLGRWMENGRFVSWETVDDEP